MSGNKELVFKCDFDEYMDFGAYKARGGFKALREAMEAGPEKVIETLKNSRLRGRGGAAFPTGAKIEMVSKAKDKTRYIICNGDEGEPGTFKDRFIMTHLPFQLLEGIIISAYAAGAERGFIYVRHEYPEAQKELKRAIATVEAAGFLGENILGSGFSLKLEIFSGAGSYLCGEETALLSSMEGKKGRPRLKPPYPTVAGLWDKPTLINNVETLSNVPCITGKGAEWYRSIGTEDSHGTKLISLSGDVRKRGLYEIPFGTTFREIIYGFGGGPKDGREVKAVNIGGASGVLVPPEFLDTPLEYASCAKAGITIGSGAVFVLDDTREILDNVHNRVRFFLGESCGKCTPCREGLRQIDILMGKFREGTAVAEDIEKLERYTRVMQDAAFCGLGQAAGNSLISSLVHYRDEYIRGCALPETETKVREEALA